MKFKLKYKKWMKAITVIFVLAITFSILSLYELCAEPILDDILPDGVISIIIWLVLILFLGYGARCNRDKVIIDSDIGNVKIYSIESIFRRSTCVKPLNNPERTYGTYIFRHFCPKILVNTQSIACGF
ncbi:MAG: hypothetical protein NC122_03765 [Faecalibacterium sp.]|nr:hypothetical protein [Ruminococcus sp.]MCM1485302.1 hypothetical protein [Faecalibacterium sp.]